MTIGKISLLLITLLFTLMSCSKCQDCYDEYGTYAGEFCRDDYSSEKEYDAAIDMVYNADGYCVEN